MLRSIPGLLAAGLLLLCCAASPAAEPGAAPNAIHYAVLSLVGDRLTVAVFGGNTGTYLSPTRKDTAPVGSPAFDDAAVLGAADALKGTGQAKLYSTGEKSLYALQDGIFADDERGREARTLISRIVGDAPADYVIVLTKYKSMAHLKMPAFVDLYQGSGDLEGIGYYVDDLKRVQSEDGHRGKGFLSSYAYLKATLLDARTMQAVRSRPQIGSDTTVNLSEDTYSWRILTEEQKAQSLQRTVRGAARDAVAALIQPGLPVASANR